VKDKSAGTTGRVARIQAPIAWVKEAIAAAMRSTQDREGEPGAEPGPAGTRRVVPARLL
jgi:hypothetical protein